MDLKEAGIALAKLGLPLLGAALPIPGGMAIGAALASAIGPDASGEVPEGPESLLRRLSTDPEARQKALEFQANHHAQMTQMVLDHEHRMHKLTIDDRDSARRANVQGGTTQQLFWLTCVLLLITLGCEAGVLFFGIPEGANEFVVGRVLGLLDSITLTVLAYWFGSSLGSTMKNPQTGTVGASERK